MQASMWPRNNHNRARRLRAPVALGLAAAVGLALAGCMAGKPEPARVKQVLDASWRSYVRHFITPEGRVVVPDRDGGSISEAQAYALLRAVWAGDEATFARVYRWTGENLCRASRGGDHLLSWHWGARGAGGWGILDENTATDADLDFALALTLAARRGWRAPPGFPGYLEEAQAVAGDILRLETVALANGELLLTPGNWHETEPPYLVNPSYFSPAAYRIFNESAPSRKVLPSPLRGEGGGGGDSPKGLPLPPTPSHQGRGDIMDSRQQQGKLPEGLSGEGDWRKLHTSTYALLARLAPGWGGRPGPGLIPDWCRVDAEGKPWPAPGRSPDFGWEAVRLPFRLALDALWFKEARAVQFLTGQFLPFFRQEWQAKGRLAAGYCQDGTPAVDFESPVLYAGVLAAALAAGDEKFAGELAGRILACYQEEGDKAFFVSPDNYYANNWAWLGLALYAGWVGPFGLQ